MTRIARILGRANVGGPARTVRALAEAFSGGGDETLLLVGAAGAREGELLESGSFRVERIDALRRSLSPADLVAYRALKERLEEFRPDVVHTHAAKAGALGRKAALALARTPRIVHTFHGHVLDGYFSRPVTAAFRLLERRLARRTDRLVAVSRRVADDLVDRHRVASRERFTVIENGIDLARFPPPDAARREAARRLLDVRGDAARVVVVPARLVPIKAHALLFDALDRVPAATRPLEVHLLGDGPLRDALEARAGRLGEGIVARFHGFRDDLPDVLPGADAVVLSSRNEGLPLALLEAMAAEAPVVATAVGGVPDLVESGETGLLSTPGDPSSLAFALARVLTDLPLARRLAAAGRARVLERHGLDRVVEEHRALYDRLARGG